MKRQQINAMLKRTDLSPFKVAKLVFNDNWLNSRLQEPILTDAEKQSLVDKLSKTEYYEFKKWCDWFFDIDSIYKAAKEHSLDSERNIFQLLWYIEKDVISREIGINFKYHYPIPVTEKQYQDLEKEDRENKLKEKYSVLWILIQMIEDELDEDCLENYIYDENADKDKNRKVVSDIFKKAVNGFISLIDQGKITPTKKTKLIPALKTSIKKTPDQIAEILLPGIYADVELPVKIFESSTVTGQNIYANYQFKYFDTFYRETSAGYAIVKDPSPFFLDENGYYESIDVISEFNKCDLKRFLKIEGVAFDFFSGRLKMISDALSFFQFYRMLLDVLSDYLSIPLNQGYEEIGLFSFEHQAESLESYRRMLFSKLNCVVSTNKKVSDFVLKHETKTVDQYYPGPKVVEYCKNKIKSMSQYSSYWFYDIKDFYMKEERIKEMSSEEIETLKTLGNKEQVRHFMSLVEQTNQGETLN